MSTITSLADITRVHAASQPDKIAMIFEDRQWTYAELDQESNQVANALIAAGVGAQDRVAHLDKNGPEYFSFLFGASKINAVGVAVNWRLAAPEMDARSNRIQPPRSADRWPARAVSRTGRGP